MKKKIGLLLLFIAVAITAGFGAYCWNYYVSYVGADTICPGVSIQGMDVGGMTKEQARKLVEEYADELSEKNVTLQANKKEKSFPLSRLGLKCAGEDAVEKAEQVGRKGNLIKRVLETRLVAGKGKDISLSFTVDKEKTASVIKKKGKQLQTKKKDAQISREDGKFVIQDETDGVAVDFSASAQKLAEIIEDPDWGQREVVMELDYEVDPALHTKKELSVIGDILGTFTTSYSGSSDGRCINVENGARLIDETVLYPGDSMSVYKKVAPFTRENGYRLAGSYENGETVQSYGGGICQVSTTLYNAVLRAELDVTERQNHSMTVHYVELSEDAAIAGTEKDLKFKNNLDEPVYIEGKTDGSNITFTIYGKEYRKKNRTIAFVSEKISTRSPSQKTINDNTLEEGKKVVEKSGTTGYTAKLWKVIYKNGEEKKRVQVNSSSYMSVPRVVRVGTKKKTAPEKESGDSKNKSKNNNKKKTQENKKKAQNKKKSGKKK